MAKNRKNNVNSAGAGPAPGEPEPRKLLDEVQAQRDKLAALVNSMSDEVWLADQDGKFTLVNSSALREFVLTPGELDVERLAAGLEVYRPDGSPRPVEEAPPLRALRGEVVRNQEELVRTTGRGELRYRQVSSAPVRDAAGRIVGSVSVVRDITERKKAEEALQKQAALIDLTPDAIMVRAVDGTITFWSRGAQSLYGWTKEEALGRQSHSLLRTQFPEPLARIDRQIQETGNWSGTLIHGCKDGRQVVVQSRWLLQPDGQDGQGEVLESNVDITEQKRAEEERERLLHEVSVHAAQLQEANDRLATANEDLAATNEELRGTTEELQSEMENRRQAEVALRESHARLTKVLEVETVGVIFWDLTTGRMTDANDTFLRMTGYSRREVEAGELTWQTLTPPEYMEMSRAEIRKFQATGRVGPYEKEYFRKDGTRRWLLFAGSSLGGNACVEFCVDIADRKETEAALRESEERFRTMADAIPQLAWIARADGHIYWYNQRWYDYTGTTPVQMEGWGWQSVHDPQQLPQVLEHWKSSLATGEPFDMVFPLRGADGIFRPFLTRVMPLKDAQGRVRQWFGTNTDVSEQKQVQEERERLLHEVSVHAAQLQEANENLAVVNEELTASNEELRVTTEELHSEIKDRKKTQEELRESEARFRRYFELGLIGMAITAPTKGWIEVNDECCRLLGYQREELVRKTWAELTYPDDLAADVLQFDRVLAGQIDGYTMEKRFVRKDGQVVDTILSVTAMRSADGAVDYLLALLQDITQRKRMENTLREWNATLESKIAARTAELVETGEKVRAERQRFLAMLDTLPVIIDILRPDHRIEWANRAYREALGDNQGHLCYARQFGRDRPCDECQAFVPLQTGKPQHWEWTLPDGRTFDIHNFLFPDADGAPMILEMDIDITERRGAEAKLRELNEALGHRARQLQKLTLQLSQAEEQERRRIAVLLHEDLQQQIAGAKFHLSLVRNRSQEERLRTEIDAVDTMLREAIEKSRTLSHDLSPSVVRPNDLAEVLQWLAPRVRAQQGLRVSVKVEDEMLLHSEALVIFLFRAAQELLFNVVKHAYIREAAIRARRIGRYVCLSVSDRGRGFDPQELQKTAGMGLFSIRERTELLGGRIRIKSAKGRGCTLRITVPDERPSQDRERMTTDMIALQTQSAAVLAPAAGRTLRVLLVDDHDIVREGLAALLQETPDILVVGEAADGRAAIDLATELEPDVVLMDVSMPLMSGDQATRQIKAYLPLTRVIALSMFDEDDKKERMFKAGAENYVLKTASSEELFAAIRGNHRGE